MSVDKASQEDVITAEADLSSKSMLDFTLVARFLLDLKVTKISQQLGKLLMDLRNKKSEIIQKIFLHTKEEKIENEIKAQACFYSGFIFQNLKNIPNSKKFMIQYFQLAEILGHPGAEISLACIPGVLSVERRLAKCYELLKNNDFESCALILGMQIKPEDLNKTSEIKIQSILFFILSEKNPMLPTSLEERQNFYFTVANFLVEYFPGKSLARSIYYYLDTIMIRLTGVKALFKTPYPYIEPLSLLVKTAYKILSEFAERESANAMCGLGGLLINYRRFFTIEYPEGVMETAFKLFKKAANLGELSGFSNISFLIKLGLFPVSPENISELESMKLSLHWMQFAAAKNDKYNWGCEKLKELIEKLVRTENPDLKKFEDNISEKERELQALREQAEQLKKQLYSEELQKPLDPRFNNLLHSAGVVTESVIREEYPQDGKGETGKRVSPSAIFVLAEDEEEGVTKRAKISPPQFKWT